MTCVACTSIAVLVRLRSYKWTMIEGYRKYYEHEKGEPLPEKGKTKIELLFQHCIECRCMEMHLTMEEEEKWNSKDSKVMESELSSSSEEEEECYSNNVNFHTDSGEEEDEDGNW
jgi:hypothetical protein